MHAALDYHAGKATRIIVDLVCKLSTLFLVGLIVYARRIRTDS